MTNHDQPDVGTWEPTPPQAPLTARAVAQAAQAGATLGSSMWFDADMVHALTHGARRAGWSATQDLLGRTLIELNVAGQRYYWILTGNARPHVDAPGRNVMEGRWPD